MATWDVSLFAHLRERHGNVVTVEAPATAAAILAALSAAGVNTAACRLAVGDEFVRPADAIPSGSEIALIPPVSGG
jgi:molybdopterin converting factor small subunit